MDEKGATLAATFKTFAQDRRRGWIVELTLETADGALWPAVDLALGQLEARGYAPLDPYAAPTAARVAANLGQMLPREQGGTGGEPDPVCSLHDVKMTRHEGAGGNTWYSHRTAEGWCNGLPPRGKGAAAAVAAGRNGGQDLGL
jgi:hypothetical protein